MGIAWSWLQFVAGGVITIVTAVIIVAIAFGILFVIWKIVSWPFAESGSYHYEPREYD